ncbi:MAG: elongation factor 1-beta [Candidatus Lokiarchaeota archaeon]|nr:elongation factor 1-beta [Candidatus Lokiarchaeota archaeon]
MRFYWAIKLLEGMSMGKHFVLAITDVMPEGVLSDDEMEELKAKLEEALKPLDTVIEVCKFEPVAFGLKKFKMRLKIPEELEGGTQPVEDALEAVDGIQRAEIGMVSRI